MSGVDVEAVWNRLDGRQQVHVYDIMCDLADGGREGRAREWLTVAEACEYSGRSRHTIRRAMEAGALHPRIPKGVTRGMRVSRDELDRWLGGE